MKFVDSKGKTVKVNIHDVTVSFAFRGRSLILTFMTGQPKQLIRPVWPDGRVEMTSDTSFLCDDEREAMAVQVAIVRILGLATGHGIQAVGPFDGSIAQNFRFVEPTERQED